MQQAQKLKPWNFVINLLSKKGLDISNVEHTEKSKLGKVCLFLINCSNSSQHSYCEDALIASGRASSNSFGRKK